MIFHTTLFLVIIQFLKTLIALTNNILIASVFGASMLTDALFMAQIFSMRIMYRIGKSINLAFIPTFTQYRISGGESKAHFMASAFITKSILFSIVIIVLYFLLSPLLTKVVAYGSSSQTKELVTHLIRFLTPAIFFFFVFSLSESLLFSYKRFRVPALASLLEGIGLFFGLIVLVRWFGIYGVAFGIIIGIFAQFLSILAPVKKKVRCSLIFNFSHPGVKKISSQALPIMISGVLYQIIYVVDRVFASGLGTGVVSALTYATRISIIIPYAIVSSLITAVIPQLSEDYANLNYTSFRNNFWHSLNILFFLVIPFSVLIAILADPLIRLIFEHGNFDRVASEATATALKYYSLGLPPQVAMLFMISVYSIMNRVNFLIPLSLVMLGINVTLNYVFVQYMGYAGLALATSICFCLQLIPYSAFLIKEIDFFNYKEILADIGKILFSTSIMGVSVLYMKSYLQTIPPPDGIPTVLLAAGIPLIFGLIVYVLLSKLVRSNSLSEAVEVLRSLKLVTKID